MRLVIFDLDGTLIDSKLDLANSVNAARAHMGLAPIANDLVYSYVGNGAPILMRRAMGAEATEKEVRRALEYFLNYYHEHKLDYTRLYPGCAEAIEELAADGVTMAVLTNKPVRISQAIVDGLGVSKYFFRVYGGNSFEQKKPDPSGVYKLLEESGVDADSALMVGDSGVDVQTARNAGIRVCGVSFGFQPEAFADDPPDYLIDRMDELPPLVANIGVMK
jgi:phosphoglycolate phosphatase